MESREIERAKCRICLEENVIVHWNEVINGYSDLTYKDCYYKYTQMEYFDEDNFSTMLCCNCSNSLEFIDAFISKAIQTHMVLQEQSLIDMNIKEDIDEIDHEASFETVLVEETEIKPEISMYEESDDEFIPVPVVETTSSSQESCTSLLPQTIKQKKHKPKNKKAKEFEKTTNHMVNDELILDDKNDTKKMDQSVCCSICPKVLANKYKAILHEKTHIKNRERNETCVECGMKFFSKGILRSHMLTHLENREKAHKCEFCDKAFYNKGALNVHRRIHLGQMISCSLCTKEFYRQVDLDQHLSSHSAARISSDMKTKRKCFVSCKTCGENVRSINFRSHTARHMNEPLFKCSICNKEFFTRKSCGKHLRIHHQKANEDIINLIVAYKKNRMSHLFLQQTANIQVKYE